LQYPDIVTTDKVTPSVRTVKYMSTTVKYMRKNDLGSIHGIPSEVHELTDVIVWLNEKHIEESIRSIWK
jgi:hypothetical protein